MRKKLFLRAGKSVCLRRKGMRRASVDESDVEAQPIKMKSFEQECCHGMAPGQDSRSLRFSFQKSESSSGDSRASSESWGELRFDQRNPEVTRDVSGGEANQITIYKHIRDAGDKNQLRKEMAAIKQEWLSDALPGDIYSALAFFGELSCSLTCFENLRKNAVHNVGFVLVVVTQFAGPPLIAWQAYSGRSMDDPEKLHWEKLLASVGVSDFYTGDGYWATKLMALMLLTLFIVNCLCWLISYSESWSKLDKLLDLLERYQGQGNHAKSLHKLGAFINSWVIFWLCLDTYILMGTAGNVQEVLMDALGLAFLYNLDDIGGDLFLVDEDDWPGGELAWVFRMAEQNDWHEEDDGDEDHCLRLCNSRSQPQPTTSLLCRLFLECCTVLVFIMAWLIPVSFTLTPFKILRPDPFYHGLHEEDWLRDFILNVSQNATRSEI